MCCLLMRTSSISVGPTVQFSEVHRFAASLQLAGPPTPGVGIHTISFDFDVQFADRNNGGGL